MDISIGAGSGSGVGSLAAGSSNLTSGLTTGSVTFTADIGTTNYVINDSFLNAVDASPIFLQIISAVKSTSGFTFVLNAPPDTGNYYLDYSVVPYV